MRVAIYGKNINSASHQSFTDLLNSLQQHRIKVIIHNVLYQFLSQNSSIALTDVDTFSTHHELKNIDFMITFGGDGTFLEAVPFARSSNIPIVGINSGRLGFLASIHQNEIILAIDHILKNNYEIRKLSLLEVTADDTHFTTFPFALNEVAIHKRDSASMITVHAHINGEFLNSYWADGLLIATPTGSTAYSLSVGGPIVHPSSSSIIINPIAPHNLNVRPLLIPANSELTLKIEGRGDSYLCSLDSRSYQFNHAIELKIKQADFQIQVIELKGHSFYATLREKLMWGADRRNP